MKLAGIITSLLVGSAAFAGNVYYAYPKINFGGHYITVDKVSCTADGFSASTDVCKVMGAQGTCAATAKETVTTGKTYMACENGGAAGCTTWVEKTIPTTYKVVGYAGNDQGGLHSPVDSIDFTIANCK